MSATLTGRAVDAEALFGAIDRFDAEAFNGFFASGASYTVSNYPPYVGRDEIATAAAAWWASVNSLRHDILEVFPFPGGFVSRLEVTYGLKDGREVTLPVAAITHTAAEKITQHRLYLNDSRSPCRLCGSFRGDEASGARLPSCLPEASFCWITRGASAWR